jgi:hypothetical protein
MNSLQGGGVGAKLTQITVTPTNKSIAKGTSLQFFATGILSSGVHQDLSSSVIWQTSPSTIASINTQGNLKGVGQGAAQVSATYEGLTGTASITIGPAVLVGIAVNPQQASLPLGESESVTAIGSFSDSSARDLTQSVTWQASPSTVASINAQGNLKGVGKGLAQISAAYQGLAGSTSITIGPAVLVGIAVNPQRDSLPLGESESVTAIASFSDGGTQDMTQSVTWRASPSTVASINAQGDLKGVGKGLAQISAAYRGLAGSASITIGPAVLVGIAVNPQQASLPLGESESLIATGTFSDGHSQNLTQLVVWSSSASAIASVSSAGAVLAKAVGQSMLTASVGSVIGTANLTVTPAVFIALNITPGSSSLLLGSSAQLNLTATLSDGTTQNTTGAAEWSSEEPSIVGISSGGMATGQQVGAAIILARIGTLTGSAVIRTIPLMNVSYFNRANAVSSGYDGTIHLINPGVSTGDQCAMIYVFAANQELNECCGCKISDSGLRTLSLVYDLTANPLSGKQPVAGTIEIVPSDSGQSGQCNAGSLVPNGMILGWETNVQGSSGSFAITEITSIPSPLSASEAEVLATECTMIQQLGSGTGTCSCGTGN